MVARAAVRALDPRRVSLGGGGCRSQKAPDLYVLHHRKAPCLPPEFSQCHPRARTQDPRLER